MPYPMGEYMDRSIVLGTEKGRLFFCCCKNSNQNGGVKTVGGGGGYCIFGKSSAHVSNCYKEKKQKFNVFETGSIIFFKIHVIMDFSVNETLFMVSCQ